MGDINEGWPTYSSPPKKYIKNFEREKKEMMKVIKESPEFVLTETWLICP
jgi:hypothetical protein